MESTRHRIVVSSENNPYVAWQTKLFYFSCVSRLKHQPLIILHESGAEIDRGFYDIIKAGGLVRTAPNYKATGSGDTYPPRNTAGTLLHAAAMCQKDDEFIVLCDPDMIFVRTPDFVQELSGGYYSYLDYSEDEVLRAGQRLGIPPELIKARGHELKCGVPYVIPVVNAQRLAEKWLAAVDAFTSRRWTDIMYAFGLAALQLDMKVSLTDNLSFNCYPESDSTGDIIHYCYGDEAWDKRHYVTAEQAGRVWESKVEAEEGTVLKEIVSQVREARDFYRDYLFERSRA